jgi:hypothetical protein
MVLEAIAVLKDTNAEVTVVLVVWSLFDVVLECRLVGKLDVAGTTPVLARIVGLIARGCGG